MPDTFASRALVDYLCGIVNSKCLNPVSNNTYALSDIAALMGNELSINLVPLLKKTNQEYFVYNVDVPIVNGQSAYTMPKRAIGNALRDVVLLDASGNEVALNNLMREYIKCAFPFNFVPSIWSFGQYITANEVNLYNTLVQSYTAYKLRFITERRPGELTLSTNCAQITSISGNQLNCVTTGLGFTTSTPVDIINQYPPFQSFGDDLAITTVNAAYITLTNAPPTGVVAGSWICPSQLSCIPQIPYEMFPLLTEYTVAAIAEAMDMSQLLASAKAKIEKYEANALSVARPRVKGSPAVIVSKDAANQRGFGNMGGGYR